MIVTKIKNRIYYLFFFFLILSSCQEEMDIPHYQKPPWVHDKLFTQLTKHQEKHGNMKNFITCLQKTGYDTIIELSGNSPYSSKSFTSSF